jgi:hypothetical protein
MNKGWVWIYFILLRPLDLGLGLCDAVLAGQSSSPPEPPYLSLALPT